MNAPTPTRGLTAVIDGVRPCSRWDPRMWETGNEGNGEAIRMCGWCPFRDRCLAENPDPRGVIVAGVPYGDWGQKVALPLAPKPEEPVIRAARPADHREDIMRRADAGATSGQIAVALNLSPQAVKGYLRRRLAAQGRAA